MAYVCFLCWISCLLLCYVGASALQLPGGPGEEGPQSHSFIYAVLLHVRGCAVGSNVRAANAQVAVRSVGERCAKPSVLIRTSYAKAEASQNRGKSDFQKSYTETLTAKEMGANVESARVPRIVPACLCPFSARQPCGIQGDVDDRGLHAMMFQSLLAQVIKQTNGCENYLCRVLRFC